MILIFRSKYQLCLFHKYFFCPKQIVFALKFEHQDKSRKLNIFSYKCPSMSGFGNPIGFWTIQYELYWTKDMVWVERYSLSFLSKSVKKDLRLLSFFTWKDLTKVLQIGLFSLVQKNDKQQLKVLATCDQKFRYNFWLGLGSKKLSKPYHDCSFIIGYPYKTNLDYSLMNFFNISYSQK